MAPASGGCHAETSLKETKGTKVLSHGQTFRSGTISFPALSSVDSGFPRLASGVNCDTLSDMLCHKCHERNATIHLNMVVGGKMTKRDLCEVCAKEHMGPAGAIPMDLLAASPAQTLAMMANNDDPRHAKETCQQCHERPATIHFCQIVGDKMTNMDLCEVCGKELADPSKFSKAIDLRTVVAGGPDQMISQLMAAYSNYAMDAYQFVRAGLDRAQKDRLRRSQVMSVHISGAELLASLCELAIERFGQQAKATLNGWGVYKCEDFGEIVFNMIEAGLLTKTDKDSKADFQGGYDFDEAFPS